MLRREALEQRRPRAIKEAAARGDEEAVMAWVGTDDGVRIEAVHGTWSDRTRVTRSLLMVAAKKGRFMLTKALLRRCAKPNWQSCGGHSALTLAVTGTCERREQGRSKVVRALPAGEDEAAALSPNVIGRGADIVSQGSAPASSSRTARSPSPSGSLRDSAADRSLTSPPSVADAASEDEAMLSRPT